ncbi:MAG: hypothetical protein VYD41_03670 [Candidatus Thermoplasmatota archaeon]|nr:hypothetical protein [Candidatus Thermoplasmatota archaeon]
MAIDLLSIVIIVIVLAATLHGIYRIARSGKRRTILPSTRTNLPEHISEGARARRRRSGSRRDRSLVPTTTEALGEGSSIGEGVQEAEVSSRDVSVLEKRLEREGAKRGAVQISLMWNNWNDLDLHLITPSGEHIYHDNRKSTCEGELDIDMNFKPTSKTPIENIVWTRTPPAGVYRIGIRHYKIHKRGLFAWAPLLSRMHMKNATDYTVSVSIGESKRFYEGTIEKSNDLQFVAKFAIAELGEGNEEGAPQEAAVEETEEFAEAKEVDALRRRVGTVRDGVSVTLNWDSSSDLGLSVVSPDGDVISFFSPDGPTGGSFDIDGYDPNKGNQVVSWTEGPPAGIYSVMVQHFEAEGEEGDTEFTVSINNRGDVEEIPGTISSDGSQVEAGTFEVS